MEKRVEITPVLERHILRVEIKYVNGQRVETVWTPDNADASKSMMNQELVSRVVTDPLTGEKRHLTINQAIRKRIEDAGIKKIHKGQNIAIEMILTGSPETMNRMSDKELDQWKNETMAWAGEQWGKENIVSAVLHVDETTPHIHLILVPIVRGLSRTSKKRDEERRRSGKEVKARPRNTSGNRLAANEVFTVPKLYAYHTSYAEKVGAHFGLGRGVRAEKGSKKKHLSSIEYNRQLERERAREQKLIEGLTAEYSAKQEELLTVNDHLAVAQENLQKVNDDMTVAQAALQQITANVAREEEKRQNAKKEADEADARLQEAKRLTVAEQKKYAALQDSGFQLMGAIKQMEGNLEKGRDLEGQIQERENYFRSLGSKSLLDFVSKIPELIKRDLTMLVNKYFKGQVASFAEVEVKNPDGDRFTVMKMDLKLEGKNYNLAVRENDGRVFLDNKLMNYKSGAPVFMKEVADYCTRTLLPEGKEFVASLYKRTEQAQVAQDPVIDALKKKYGEITVNSVTALTTNNKVSGRMYHFTVEGKKRTAVSDYDAREISISPGHVKQGSFYLFDWKTLDGKLACGVGNRVVSREYRKHHKGRSI